MEKLTRRIDLDLRAELTKTERAGFEPAVPNGYTGFRNQHDKPLRHLSKLLLNKDLGFF